MRDIFSEVDQWSKKGQVIALATVIKTWGSSPRTVGAKMAVNELGEMVGSVSGGCVEGAVVTACARTIQSGEPQRLHFDIADETAWDVGVACGGQLDVIVRLLTADMMAFYRQVIDSGETFAVSTIVDGDQDILGKELWQTEGSSVVGSVRADLDAQISEKIAAALIGGKPVLEKLTEEIELFTDVVLPQPTLIVVGGVHIAISLVKIAKASGYRVIVIDPRRQFGTVGRFPQADQIIHQWPDEAFESIKLTRNTAVAMLTHDPKIDDPGLIVALESQVFYIGALGSSKTQAARRERLLELGVDEKYLARIHGPIGLDLGGRSPEEIAVSIMAEIIQQRHAGSRKKGKG